MRVITLTRFHDIENGVTREIGDTFEVKKARGLFLIEKGVVGQISKSAKPEKVVDIILPESGEEEVEGKKTKKE